MALEIECQSSEYVRVRVKATENGAEIDPTTYTVEFAFVAVGSAPEVADWDAGAWETGGPPYWARFLFDASAYGEGTFQGYIRVTTPAESVVKKVCLITVCDCEEAS